MRNKVVSGKKLYEQVLEKLESQILQGVYQKGDYLPTEKKLVEQFGVSRITVREALRVLSENGVIATKKGSGSVVQMDANDLHNSMSMLPDYREAFLNSTKARILIEPSIAQELALHASEEEIGQIAQSLNQGNASDLFHHTLVQLTHNPVVEEWFNHLFTLEEDGEYTRSVPPAYQKKTAREFANQHRKVFEAIQNHKPDFAFFYMKEHLEFVYKTYQEYFDML